MIQLKPHECRVLGVLIEKAHTSSSYPMSLNALVAGCNQLSNRNPVVSYNEDLIVTALDGLRDKGLAIFADTLGGRVMKYRHNARETLGVETPELAVLTELLLRGPQTMGELRARASRMHPLDSLDAVRDAIAKLTDRPEPLVRRLPPSPGSRAERYVQLLCPNLHPLDMPAESAEGLAASPVGARMAWQAPAVSAGPQAVGASATEAPSSVPQSEGLAGRVAKLEDEVARLRAAIVRLAQALGENDTIA